jgi:zinc protease
MSERPIPSTARSYRFPNVRHHQTANGIDIVVATVTRVPVVTVQFVIDGGAIYEPVESAGTAQLTAKALAEGTDQQSGDELAERFELLGCSVEPDAGWEAIELHSTVMSSRLAETITLAGNILMVPAFRDDDLVRLRDERLAELMQREVEPRGLADDAFFGALYSSQARPHLPVGGEREMVLAFGASRARDWHKRMIRPERLAVIVVGDVQANDVFAAVTHSFESWRVPDGAPVSRPNEALPSDASMHFVVRAKAAQSEVRIGHVGPPRGHEDYFALTVLNAILGGLFGSRINLNLREAHGYTYGAFSGFDWRRDGSAFCVSTAVRSDATVPAIKEIRKEIKRIREEPVSAAELSLALEHLEGVFPIRFETTDALANALATQRIFCLAATYFDEYRDRIRAVSADEVQRAARAHLRPADLQTVIVGSSALREELTAFADGELVVIEDSLSDMG